MYCDLRLMIRGQLGWQGFSQDCPVPSVSCFKCLKFFSIDPYGLPPKPAKPDQAGHTNTRNQGKHINPVTPDEKTQQSGCMQHIPPIQQDPKQPLTVTERKSENEATYGWSEREKQPNAGTAVPFDIFCPSVLCYSLSLSLLCVCCKARAGGSVWLDNGRPGRGEGCREEWEAILKSYCCH